MAQTAMCRLFQSARSVHQSILKPTQVRSFGSKTIPSFTSTPVPELNAALEHFRKELFIPFGLPKRQQKSIFTPRYAQNLQNEPIVVDINKDEKFTLTPKNRYELPTKRQAVAVLTMMVENKDYSNLFPFMCGLKMAGYVINTDRWEYLIRKASLAGELPAILHCASQGKSTGLSLGDKNVARLLFFEFHQTASRVNFEPCQTLHALKLARQALTLMNDPLHSSKDVQEDPKSQPFVIATLLELSAASPENLGAPTSEGQPASETQESLVRDYAQKLDARWSRLNSGEGSTQGEKIANLRENLTVYNAMRLSLKFPKALKETQSFQTRIDELKPVLIQQLKEIKSAHVTADLVAKQLLELRV